MAQFLVHSMCTFQTLQYNTNINVLQLSSIHLFNWHIDVNILRPQHLTKTTVTKWIIAKLRITASWIYICVNGTETYSMHESSQHHWHDAENVWQTRNMNFTTTSRHHINYVRLFTFSAWRPHSALYPSHSCTHHTTPHSTLLHKKPVTQG